MSYIPFMRSIMPPGYSREARRKCLERELRQARAAELAVADEMQRACIEKEIRTEVEKRLGKSISHSFLHGGVLW